MELPADVIEQVTRQSRIRRGEYAGGRRREKRHTGRLPMLLKTAIVPVDAPSAAPRQVRLRDLSPTGLCILCDDSMPRGQQFVIGLPRDRSTPLFVRCAVVRSDRADGGIFIIGARFVRLLTPAGHAVSR